MIPNGSKRFVMKLFARHYTESPLDMPERFARREFGFMFFDRTFMMRHMAFPSRAALKKYLVEQTPSHAYYSTAYYEKPDAPTMPEKSWLGADLLFDLDADHVEGTKGQSYEQMLARVKQEVTRLIDEFLNEDLGFDEGDLKIVFSGGRGYHVHVNSQKVLKLTSHERREIVDYVTGTGLDLDWVFPRSAFEQSRFKDRSGVSHKRDMPTHADGGWKRRIRKGIEELLAELEEMPEEDAKRLVSEALTASKRDIGPKTIGGLYEDLFVKNKDKSGADRMRDEDTFEVFSEKRNSDAFLELVDLRVKGKVKGETDEPVTSDVRRLIRLPSSLHGKTGFEVMPMTREKLDGFDPFRDAVPRAFGEEEVGVTLEAPASVTLRGVGFDLDAGPTKVPSYAAVHLICRNLASLDN
ncbi:MAG: DNA primase catalytic subunit PriS [Candidatus Thermoplasmatota archaeon]|nr:DNA primase catalytic subunit PriS [Candidatus Thermoplasmatota archaeon]